MTKAYSVLTVKAITDTDDERTITGIASTPTMDRDSDIVEAKGAIFAIVSIALVFGTAGLPHRNLYESFAHAGDLTPFFLR